MDAPLATLRISGIPNGTEGSGGGQNIRTGIVVGVGARRALAHHLPQCHSGPRITNPEPHSNWTSRRPTSHDTPAGSGEGRHEHD